MPEKDMLTSSSLARIALLVFLGVSASGCEVVGGIFKAGMWVGALGVILIVVVLVVMGKKLKR
jgi:positive regulator of sigma E activity